MKFILWTLVWFGVCIIGEFLLVEQMGGWSVYVTEYSQSTRSLNGLLELALWITLYYAIIKGER